MKVKLVGNLGLKIEEATLKKQMIVDSSVIKYTKPYIPYDTGALTESLEKHSVIGSGRLVQGMPYALPIYYGFDFNFQKHVHPLAGPVWFERMKADHLDDIKREVGAK